MNASLERIDSFQHTYRKLTLTRDSAVAEEPRDAQWRKSGWNSGGAEWTQKAF